MFNWFRTKSMPWLVSSACIFSFFLILFLDWKDGKIATTPISDYVMLGIALTFGALLFGSWSRSVPEITKPVNAVNQR